MQPIEILLDRPRHLRFTGNSLAWLEEELRKPEESFTQFLQRFLRQFYDQNQAGDGSVTVVFPGMQTLRYTLCACLRTEDRSLTPDWCGDWLTPGRNAEILEKCLLAINAYYEGARKDPLPLASKPDSAEADTGLSADTTSASATATPTP